MLNWVEIDADAIRWNLKEFRRRVGPEVELGAVVKSNAYGHGMLEVVPIVLEAGATWLCVNNVGEAIGLRSAGFTGRILVLGYVPKDALEAVVEHRLRPIVYNAETIDHLDQLAADAGVTVLVHLKIETGTTRQGVDEADVPEFIERIAASRALRLEGASTHFANIEDTTDHSFAERQMATFSRVIERIRASGTDVPVVHAACSAATLLFTRTHFDLARLGIALYGIWPSKETYVSCLERGKPTLDLRPALTWKTRVAQVKTVPEGSYVGYGCTYRTTRESRIAVLPVGYHEGYDRSLSNTGHVLVRGRRAPVRGRVCMNMTLVDVTDVHGVSLEDEVVLLGTQGDEHLRAEQLAEWCGTIPYEILARIHPSLPRVLVRRPVPEPAAGRS